MIGLCSNFPLSPPRFDMRIKPKFPGKLQFSVCFFFICSQTQVPLGMTNEPNIIAKPTPKERKKHDRFNGMSEEEVSKRTLPDHLANNLDIIIVSVIFQFAIFLLVALFRPTICRKKKNLFLRIHFHTIQQICANIHAILN